MLLAVLALAPAHAVENGDFGRFPNTAWMADRMDGRAGDRPAVVPGSVGNHFAHLGDRDGRGADGLSPARIYQWIDVPGASGAGPHGRVTFRFQSLLLPDEVAWVRLRSGEHERTLPIPNSNNRWAAIRPTVTVPDGCDGESLYVEFGMLRRDGGPIGGRLNVDDVKFSCVEDLVGDPGLIEGLDLPPFPTEEGSVLVHGERTPAATIQANLDPRIAALIVAAIALALFRLRRQNASRTDSEP